MFILKDPKRLCVTACYGPGMDNHGAMDHSSTTMVTASNVNQFNKCTKIFGSLAFHSQSFTRYEALGPQRIPDVHCHQQKLGDECKKRNESRLFPLSRDPVTNASGLTPEQLSVFRNLEEITGTHCLSLY